MPEDHTTSARVIQNGNPSWEPVRGEELERLLSNKFPDDEEARDAVRESTLSILSRCVPPQATESPSRTGLIVGQVQSGKTMSFTAVAAAARDNGFRTIVVIAGSSLNLADQNRDRLATDLGIGTSPFRPWYRKHNAALAQLDELRTALAGWDNGSGKTLVLTSLKHYTHVRNLGRLLEALGESASPMLIIDDEADQISLNSRVNAGQESTNYTEILGLRTQAALHTYLQYTATPQANIFIPLCDRLSPDFCELLTPGDGYVGGHRVFIERGDDLVRVIPNDDLACLDDLLECPESLYDAMRVFLLGVAQGYWEYNQTGQEPRPSNRSMMVHPDRSQESHRVFASWIRTARDSWRRLLQDPSDPDYGMLAGSFQASYDDLSRTDQSGDLAPFSELLALLPEVIGQTQIREVNARPGVDRTDWSSEWGSAYQWILVGGQGLDRGFTVEGLTVSYMPRDIGTGQADTVQQRARFFGYKRHYEDLCRIYLGPAAHAAFRVYVRHENSMRDFLERNKDRLSDPSLPREFELDPILRPTRPQVLVNYPQRYRLRNGWLAQENPLAQEDRSRRNGALVEGFVASHGGFQAIASPPWIVDENGIRDDHRHLGIVGIPLALVYTDLLASIVLSDPDEHVRWQVALSMIANAVDETPDLLAAIIRMRPGSSPRRGLTATGKIPQVFAGAHPGTPPYAYLGDRDVVSDAVTLQLHVFDLEGNVDVDGDVQLVRAENVPVLALKLGDEVNRPMIRQEPVVE